MDRRTTHGIVFWKTRIEELVNQYNMLIRIKIDYSEIDKQIGDDIEKAIAVYSQLQEEYIVYIRTNFFKDRQRKSKV